MSSVRNSLNIIREILQSSLIKAAVCVNLSQVFLRNTFSFDYWNPFWHGTKVDKATLPMNVGLMSLDALP